MRVAGSHSDRVKDALAVIRQYEVNNLATPDLLSREVRAWFRKGGQQMTQSAARESDERSDG